MFENPTVSFNALCNSCAKIACCSSDLIFTFLYAGSSIQNASELFVSCIHLPFVNFAHEVRFGDSNSDISVTIQN
jgi:hypothetical protein